MPNYFQKVLIIDDDSVDRWIMRKSMNKINFSKEILEAENGADGLKMITDHSNGVLLPELIFLDVNMPVLDGFGFLDVFEQLSREYKKRCRIAVVSANESEKEKKHALKYESVIGYFEKPLKEEVLFQLMDQLRFTQAC
jgi:CheY-like chemotaxis protein